MENNGNFKYCPHCGAALESDYIYCPSCGKSTEAAGYSGNAQNGGFNPNTGFADSVDNIEDIPVAEINDYVGKNSHKFIPKFFKHAFGSKANWNWPTFLFGFLLGMPFIWLFHRKLYKVGAIVLAITLALSLGTLACVGVMLDAAREPIEDYVENMAALDEKYGYDYWNFGLVPEGESIEYSAQYIDEAEGITSDLIDEFMTLNAFTTASTVIQLISYLQLALVIVTSIFADYWYYKKTVSDLKKLNANGYPNGYAVQAAGGTKAWVPVVVAIGTVVLLSAVACAVFVPFVLGIAEAVYEAI